ncbi:isochorismate synthase [soil metagenome]
MPARRLVARTTACDPDIDFLACARRPGSIVWARGDRLLVSWGQVGRIDPGSGDGRFERASEELRSLFERIEVEDEADEWGAGPIAFGAFAFDPDSPGSALIVPSVILGRDGRRSWITTIGTDPHPLGASALEQRRSRTAEAALLEGGARRMTPSFDEESWLAAVALARDSVQDGIIEKVVLARAALVSCDRPFDVMEVVSHLALSFPECYTFAFDGLVGATPELLVRRRGSSVRSIVLGGSAAREVDERDDRRAGKRLLSSHKDRREHDLAVASVREALERTCLEVAAEDEPCLLKLPYVQHLRTEVRARLARSLTALELAGALHPSAAVCGVPTDKALATIRELEGLDRGRYCGPVGWVDARGDGEWGIALRCAELAGSGARLFAGAGIVGDSDPAAELAETEWKLRPLLDALGVAPG